MIENSISDLLERSKKTKNACFQASRRLDKISNLSLLSLSSIAISLIVISIFFIAFKDNAYVLKEGFFLQVIQIVISIVALSISVLSHKQDYSLKSDKYRNQGMDINHLRFKLKVFKDAGGAYSKDAILMFGSDYDNILQRYIVHDDIDHKVTCSNGIEWVFYKIKLFFIYYLPWYIVIFLNAFFLFSTISGVMNYME